MWTVQTHTGVCVNSCYSTVWTQTWLHRVNHFFVESFHFRCRSFNKLTINRFFNETRHTRTHFTSKGVDSATHPLRKAFLSSVNQTSCRMRVSHLLWEVLLLLSLDGTFHFHLQLRVSSTTGRRRLMHWGLKWLFFHLLHLSHLCRTSFLLPLCVATFLSTLQHPPFFIKHFFF